MDGFERELGGPWRDDEEESVLEMQERADADEIRTDARGAAYWRESGRYLDMGCAEILSRTDFSFSEEATERARKLQAVMVLASYWQGKEESMALKVAPDRSITVLNLMTGERTRL